MTERYNPTSDEFSEVMTAVDDLVYRIADKWNWPAYEAGELVAQRVLHAMQPADFDGERKWRHYIFMEFSRFLDYTRDCGCNDQEEVENAN